MGARRVLFLNNQGLDQAGGGVTIMRHLARHLARECRVTVLAESRLQRPIEGIEELCLPPMPPPRGPLWRLDPLRRARFWARVVPDLAPPAGVVIALDCHFAGALARIPDAARLYLSLSAIPRMEWFLSDGPGRAGSFLQYFRLERRMIGLADRVLVSSETHRREIRRFELLPRFAPRVLPPVFPLETGSTELPVPPEIAALRSRAEPGTGPVVILSVARLVPLKGLSVVPALAHRLRDCPCVFVVVGDGPERARIERRAQELGVTDRVRALGPRADLAPYYAAADLFFHPSRYESFGMSCFEAMQRGVPVICGLPGPRAVVAMAEFIEHGREGWLVDLEDQASIAGALRELVEDRELRERLGRAARERTGLLLERDYVASVEEILDELLSGRSPGSRS